MLDVFDVSDPTVTTQLTSSVPLSSNPFDVVIADAIAFVAGGDSGLQIVNYLPLDTSGAAPSLTISSPVLDADPSTPGLQVFEGTTIPLQVDVNDDVQVRVVDLLSNGSQVSTDISAPYEISGIALSNQGSQLELQARGIDTGGNVGLSNTLVYDIIPDNTPPRIVSINPANGSTVGEGFRAVEIEFSKRMSDNAALSGNYTFSQLANPIEPLDIQLRNDDQSAVLLFDPLLPGNYQLTIDAASITDRAGNPLGNANIDFNFSIAEFTTEWIGTDGFWDDPSNWSGGVVPGVSDVVLIDVPGDRTITHRTSTTTVAGIVSRESFLNQSGNFTVTGSGSFNDLSLPGGTFTSDSIAVIEDLSLSGATATVMANNEIQLTGSSTISAGKFAGVGKVINSGVMTLLATSPVADDTRKSKSHQCCG